MHDTIQLRRDFQYILKSSVSDKMAAEWLLPTATKIVDKNNLKLKLVIHNTHESEL